MLPRNGERLSYFGTNFYKINKLERMCKKMGFGLQLVHAPYHFVRQWLNQRTNKT